MLALVAVAAGRAGFAVEGEVYVGGNFGRGKRELNHPAGLLVDDTGNLYVADRDNARCLRYGPESRRLPAADVAFKNPRLQRPSRLAQGSAGELFVSDRSEHVVYQLIFRTWNSWSPDLVVVAGGNGKGSEPGQLYFPSGIAVDGADGLFVSEVANHRVTRWKLYSNPYSWKFYEVPDHYIVAGGRGEGKALDQLSFPEGLLVARGGKDLEVYVADTNNHRVVRVKRGGEGEIIAGGRGPGSDITALNRPTDLVLDPGGRVIYVVDTMNNRVVSWGLTEHRGPASVAVVAGGYGAGSRLHQLNWPTAAALDIDGNLLVADGTNDRVLRFAYLADAGTRPALLPHSAATQGRPTGSSEGFAEPERDELPGGIFIPVASAGLAFVMLSGVLTMCANREPPRDPALTQQILVVQGRDTATQSPRPEAALVELQANETNPVNVRE